MQKGTINVQSENIFPIIKKFLYSDHEIFLREIVSNAVDATQKLNGLSSIGEFKGDVGDVTIEVAIDSKKKTLTVSDKGIGMTEEEVGKYINEVAFSSAEEFLEKFKDKGAESQIIGHFGLGFYSSFMVSDKVELVSKSYKKDAAIKWSCDGSPNYELDKSDKKDRGTDIVMYINEESKEFLEKERIKTILNKYCKFLPVEIKFDGEVINNTKPAWTKKPSNLKKEDYENFYKELYPYSEPPLFWIHLNVDYPFNLTGILYFPKIKTGVEVQKDKIQLYSNQVFITDSVEEIVPEFLTLLHGVIDSPDIPLNVSRSYLQSDGNVKKINSYITKKVADKLQELFKKERAEFEDKWKDIGVFVKYGMISDDKFYERSNGFCLLKDTEGKHFTIEEYKKEIEAEQTDKDKKVVILYTTDLVEQNSFIEAARKKKYSVLELNGPLDNHFIGMFEQKFSDFTLKRVDADTIDKLVDKDKKTKSALKKADKEKLQKTIEEEINNPTCTVMMENLSKSDQPVMITKPEFNRRMKEMAAMQGGGMDFMANMPEQFNLIVNTNHPLIAKIVETKSKDKQKAMIKQVYDLAMLAQNMLKGKALTDFVSRSVDLI